MTPEITITGCPYNHSSYVVDFFGTPIDVNVTSSASVVRKWLRTTLFLRRCYIGRLVVGVAVQWSPWNVGTRCLIFQLSVATTVPSILRRFLLYPDNTFVGVWNSLDRKKLWMSEHELRIDRLLDLRRYVSTDYGESLARASLERIVEECLGYEGVRLEKHISMNDWGDEDFSYE
ncbi:hypothetical protein P3X46_027944 [Hevea brasiliensis]|uniref:3'-5' exonuclease domain-containing protein n=1 Tax=Hevea brasiliensis TaxID=3981 RepID=A0ABQ9L1F0_HEVBR|nr:hypothetical protein P3X46_027944 [Hevea brasiliensis]